MTRDRSKESRRLIEADVSAGIKLMVEGMRQVAQDLKRECVRLENNRQHGTIEAVDRNAMVICTLARALNEKARSLKQATDREAKRIEKAHADRANRHYIA